MSTHTIDNFTDTNGTNLESHTPDSGGPWTKSDGVAGTYTIQSNHLQENSQGTDGGWRVPVGTADMYAEITAGSGWGGDGSFGPCNRLTDSNNFVGMRGQGNNELQMYKRVTGSFTQLRDVTGLTLNSGDVFRLTVTGNVYQMLQNGINRGASVTDSFNNTETYAGLVHHTGSASPYITKWQSDTNGAAVTPSVGLLSMMGCA